MDDDFQVEFKLDSRSQMSEEKMIPFGQYFCHPNQVFYKSKKCIGLVNLKPVVPGDHENVG